MTRLLLMSIVAACSVDEPSYTSSDEVIELPGAPAGCQVFLSVPARGCGLDLSTEGAQRVGQIWGVANGGCNLTRDGAAARWAFRVEEPGHRGPVSCSYDGCDSPVLQIGEPQRRVPAGAQVWWDAGASLVDLAEPVWDRRANTVAIAELVFAPCPGGWGPSAR